MGPEETCVFATYKTIVGGREIIVCCPNCASDLEQAATQPAIPAPAGKRPARKTARNVKRRGKKAVRKGKKAPERKRKSAKMVKRAVRKPAHRRR